MFNKQPLFNRNDPVQRRAAGVPTLTPERPVIESAPAKPDTLPSAATAPVTNRGATAPMAPPPSASPPPRDVALSTTPGSGEQPSTGARLLVGPDVKLKGAEILDCDTLVVEGRVEATMDSRVLRIAEQGNFAGTVSVDVAEIHGSFDGQLTARAQLVIHASGRVSGTIRYGKLVAEEGCELRGDVNVISPDAPERARPPAEPVLVLSAAG